MKTAWIAVAAAAAAFTGTAHATTIEDLLLRNAAQQARIERDVARGRVDPLRAAQVESRAAEVYRLESALFQQPRVSGADRARLLQAQWDLNGAIAWAEKHPAQRRGDAMDRVHLRVASMRDAAQQRSIAREFHDGRLQVPQVAKLEAAQARIAAAESAAMRRGHEGAAAAESIQHLQNIEDYAIRKDPALA
jgi:hypothetical protein